MNQDDLKAKYRAGEQKVDSWLKRLIDSQYTLVIVIMIGVVAAYLYFVK